MLLTDSIYLHPVFCLDSSEVSLSFLIKMGSFKAGQMKGGGGGGGV